MGLSVLFLFLPLTIFAMIFIAIWYLIEPGNGAGDRDHEAVGQPVSALRASPPGDPSDARDGPLLP